MSASAPRREWLAVCQHRRQGERGWQYVSIGVKARVAGNVSIRDKIGCLEGKQIGGTGMQFISFAVIFKRIKAIKFMMRDKNVSFWKKALIVFGIIYLVLPVDLIPPIIPVFGFLDDLILWLFILDYLKDELDKYWAQEDPAERVKQTKKKYRGKNIVDGVEYEVWVDGERPDDPGRTDDQTDDGSKESEDSGKEKDAGSKDSEDGGQ